MTNRQQQNNPDASPQDDPRRMHTLMKRVGILQRNREMRFLCSLTAAFLGISSIAHADSISGTFVGKSESSVSLVQLVESGGGQLTGRYQDFALLPDGKTIGVNASLTGVRDGQMVVVTIKPTQFLSSSITASGAWSGRVLHLAGGINGNNIALNLTRSDEADFYAEVATLTLRAEQIGEVRTRKEVIGRINELVRRMNAFAKENDGTLGGFAPTEARYRLITENMRRAFTHARSVHGDDQASAARVQIYLAINQAAIEADQIHMAVQTASDRFNAQFNALNQDHNTLRQSCQTASAVTAVASQHDELSATCQAMMESAKMFGRSVASTQSAFAHMEEVWRVERPQQEKIDRAADASD